MVSIDPERTLDALGPYEPVGPVEPHPLQWTDDGGLITVRVVRAMSEHAFVSRAADR